MKRPTWLTAAVKRKLYLVAGILFFVLGVLGLFLPVLQGGLFLLVSLVLLSKGSSRVRALKQKFKRRYPKWGAKVEAAEKWSRGLSGRMTARVKAWLGRR